MLDEKSADIAVFLVRAHPQGFALTGEERRERR